MQQDRGPHPVGAPGVRDLFPDASSGGSGRPYAAATAPRLMSSATGSASARPHPRVRIACAVHGPTPGRSRSSAMATSSGSDRSRSVSSRPSSAARARVVDATELDGGESLDVVRLEQPLRSRERPIRGAVDLDGIAVRCRQPVLDDAALPHRDAVADDERGGGLVRRVETDRTEPVISARDRADDRVALTDLQPSAPVMVERQRSRDLPPGALDVGRCREPRRGRCRRRSATRPPRHSPSTPRQGTSRAGRSRRRAPRSQPGSRRRSRAQPTARTGRAARSRRLPPQRGPIQASGDEFDHLRLRLVVIARPRLEQARASPVAGGRGGPPRTEAHRLPGRPRASPASPSGPESLEGQRRSSSQPRRAHDQEREAEEHGDEDRRVGHVTIFSLSSSEPSCPALPTGCSPAPASGPVYDRPHADLPRSRGDHAGPPRGPRCHAPVPDRGLRQPEFGPLLRSDGSGRARRRSRPCRDAPQRECPRDRLHIRRHRGQQPCPQGRGLGGQGPRSPDRHIRCRASRGRPHAAVPREVRLRGRRAAGRSIWPGRSRPARTGHDGSDDPRVDHARQQRSRDGPADRRPRRPAFTRGAASSSTWTRSRPRRGSTSMSRRSASTCCRSQRTSSRDRRASGRCTSATAHTSCPSSRVAARSATVERGRRTSRERSGSPSPTT